MKSLTAFHKNWLTIATVVLLTTSAAAQIGTRNGGRVQPIIAPGDHHTLMLEKGNVWSWGRNLEGQLGNNSTTNSNTKVQVLNLSSVIAIAGGRYHSLALKSDGTVWAWGWNLYGQLGNGNNNQSNVPVQVNNLTGVVAISGGKDHSSALKADGTVWAWGRNNYGQLGNGNNNDSNVPVQITGLTGVSSISAGGYHCLSIKPDGTVWTWGYGLYGQLGNGANTNQNVPVQVKGPGGVGFLSGVSRIAGGVVHSVAKKSNGTVWTWGFNGTGELGDATNIDRNTPVQVKGVGGAGFLTNVVLVDAKGNHNLALKSNGSVCSWGYNFYGQLGDGTNTNRNTPVQVSGLTGGAIIATGDAHSLAFKSDGNIKTWGYNFYGQLGDGTNTNRTTPVQATNITGVLTIGAGNYHSLAVKADGTGRGWGHNGRGQVGNGTTTNQLSPVQVSGLTNAIMIDGGRLHSLAVKSDGTAWAWGANVYGQLGDGTTTQRTTPVQVKGPGGVGFLTDVIVVSAGGTLLYGTDGYSLALKSDGTVWAWGENDFGQLGDGTDIDKTTPVQVKGLGGAGFLTDVVAISAGGFHNLALKSDGTVRAWGYNYDGELGDGTTDNYKSTPVQVTGPGGVGFLTNVVAISAGEYHSLALKADGTVWAWGSNLSGELGDGTQIERITPVQVKGLGGVGFLTSVIAISSGGAVYFPGDGAHNLALKSDGIVWGWGFNMWGELGDGTSVSPRTTPVQTLGTGVIAIAAGGLHSLIHKAADWSVWATGLNYAGQLGNGTTSTQYSYVFSLSKRSNDSSVDFFKDDKEKQVTYELYQNYPNPFNPITMIKFGLSTDQNVTLRVYNTLGQIVATPYNDRQLSAGYHTVSFDGSGLTSGVYTYVIEISGDDGTRQTISRKMLLVK